MQACDTQGPLALCHGISLEHVEFLLSLQCHHVIFTFQTKTGLTLVLILQKFFFPECVLCAVSFEFMSFPYI